MKGLTFVPYKIIALNLTFFKGSTNKNTIILGDWGGAIQGWESGRYKLLGIRQAQGCIVQHGEYSQYFVITVNGK